MYPAGKLVAQNLMWIAVGLIWLPGRAVIQHRCMDFAPGQQGVKGLAS